MPITSLQGEIVQWLERKREQYLNLAKELNIPPSITVLRRAVTDITESGFTASEQEVQTTPLADSRLYIALRDKLQTAPDDVPGSPAAALNEEYRHRCKIWCVYHTSLWENDPIGWIYTTLLSRVQHEYLSQIHSLESPDLRLAETLAGDLLLLLEGESVWFVSVLPLGGIIPANQFVEVENVRLRAITTDELAQIMDQTGFSSWRQFHSRELMPPFPRMSHETAVLEVRNACSKYTQPKGTLDAKKLVLALQLLGFELYGRGQATVWTEPGPSLITGGQSGFIIGNHGTSRQCGAETLRHALALARLIPDGAVVNPRERREVALHRFLLGCAEDNSADSLIDFVIAMEGFLLPPAKEGEYRFKFGLFGAWYLAVDPDERETLFKQLVDIYDARSQIVHGNAPPLEVTLREHAKKARTITARLFVKGLEQGWPSHEAFKHLALGRLHQTADSKPVKNDIHLNMEPATPESAQGLIDSDS